MTAANTPMKRLYSKLQTVGYNPKYIRSLLPEWWDEEIADTPAGLQQASLILGQRFGVRAESLWTESTTPVLRLPLGIHFKHRDNVDAGDLRIACALAQSLARIVLKAFPETPLPHFYLDAGELRKQLLEGKKWISFQDLLAYCLSLGIPVIYLQHLPNRAKKMEGLAFEQNGRPVIVLTRKNAHGYMLFDLAHELGHISLGHVSAEHSVIDQKIDVEAGEDDERAANRFALELLTGNPECKIVPVGGRWLKGCQLAHAAMICAERNQVDPLHIVLNYGHTTKQWGPANMAIKEIAGNDPSDQETLRETLLQSLDFDVLSEDDYMLLQTHLSGSAV
ncbi:MAG TPA: hypothetical protein DCZ48_13510 [Methylococcaceae bacterium]|nr:hypothetical protein [Methylococcaceae bacterium]